MGVMITYGSYIGKKENLNSVAFQAVAADTVIALLAGTAIFPMAFAFGIAPDSGPGLIFVTLPNVLRGCRAVIFLVFCSLRWWRWQL